MPTDKEFEDFFRHRFDKLEETPPAHAWENIRKQIAPQRRFRWLPALIFMGLLAIATLTPYLARTFLSPAASIAAQNNRPEQPAATAMAAEPVNPTAETNAFARETGKAGNPKNSLNSRAGAAPATESKTNKLPASQAVNWKTAEKAALRAEKARAVYAAAIRKAEKREIRSAMNQQNATAKAEKTARKQYDQNEKAAGKTIAAYKTPQRKSGSKQTVTDRSAEYYVASGSKATNPKKAGISGPDRTKRIAEAEAPATGKVAGVVSGNNKAALENEKTLASLPADTMYVAVPTELFSDSYNPDTTLHKVYVVPKLALLAYGSPRYAFQHLSQPAEETGTSQVAAEKSFSESVGYEAGLLLQLGLGANTSVDAGFTLTQLQASTHMLQAALPATLSTRATYGGLRVGLTQSIYNMRKSRFYVSGGSALQLLLQGTASLKTNAGEQAVSNDLLRQTNFNVFTGLGYERAITSRMAFTFEPAITYYLQSALTQKAPFSQKPLTTGLNIGLKYGF